MHINGSLPRLSETPTASARGSTYDTSNNVRAGDVRNRSETVEAARATALSALHNDRFSSMLATLSEPAASGTLMTMTREAGATSTDFNSILSSYADNGE